MHTFKTSFTLTSGGLYAPTEVVEEVVLGNQGETDPQGLTKSTT